MRRKYKIIVDPLGENLDLFFMFLNDSGFVEGEEWEQIGKNVFRVDENTRSLVKLSLSDIVAYWTFP